MANSKKTDWETRKKSNEKLIEIYTALRDKAPKNSQKKYTAYLNDLKKENKYNRWSVTSSKEGTEQIKALISHEYGHIIADQYFGQINKHRANSNFEYNHNNPVYKLYLMVEDTYMKARQKGDIYKMSMYADSSSHEFFAESFAMHEMGEQLPDYIENMLQEVFNSGTMQ